MLANVIEQSIVEGIPEQRVVLYGVSWQQYESILFTLGDDFPNLRWFWKNHQFSLYALRSENYEELVRSELLPNLDLFLLATYVKPSEQYDAVMEFREVIRQSQQP